MRYVNYVDILTYAYMCCTAVILLCSSLLKRKLEELTPQSRFVLHTSKYKIQQVGSCFHLVNALWQVILIDTAVSMFTSGAHARSARA